MKDQGGDPEFGRYLLAVAAFFPRGNLNVVIRAFAAEVDRAAEASENYEPVTVDDFDDVGDLDLKDINRPQDAPHDILAETEQRMGELWV